MSDTWIAALSALCTGLLSLLGVYVANRKNSAVIEFRIGQLEKKMDKHNQILERTYALEGRMTEAEHDIRDLKGARSA